MSPTAQDAVFAWLVGGGDNASPELPSGIGVTDGVVGLLGRLAQAFPGNPVGPSERIAVGAGAAGLSIPRQALSAVVSVEVAAVRLQTDGTEVTSTTGVVLTLGALVLLTGRPTMEAARFLGTVAGTFVSVLYFE